MIEERAEGDRPINSYCFFNYFCLPYFVTLIANVIEDKEFKSIAVVCRGRKGPDDDGD